MPEHHDPKLNRLLAALPAAEWRRWQPQLEWVPLTLGQVLHESGLGMDHVYFPTDAIVSLLHVMDSGASAEIAVVGHEGVVNVTQFLGDGPITCRAVVQSAGQSWRLRGKTMQDEFNLSHPVMRLMLRYSLALISQMAQTTACNRHHALDQQLCRWLLLSLDRRGGDELLMTPALMANMLGVPDEGVTSAAQRLLRAGLIRYDAGRITVLDRPGLEARACECYAVVKKEYDRLLPPRVAS